MLEIYRNKDKEIKDGSLNNKLYNELSLFYCELAVIYVNEISTLKHVIQSQVTGIFFGMCISICRLKLYVEHFVPQRDIDLSVC